MPLYGNLVIGEFESGVPPCKRNWVQEKPLYKRKSHVSLGLSYIQVRLYLIIHFCVDKRLRVTCLDTFAYGSSNSSPINSSKANLK